MSRIPPDAIPPVIAPVIAPPDAPPPGIPAMGATMVRTMSPDRPGASGPVRAVPWTIANAVFQLASKFGTLIILSRVLSAAEFGLFYIGLPIAVVVGTVAQMGIATNIVFLPEATSRTVASALWLGFGSGLLWAGLTGVGYFHLYGGTGGAMDGIMLAVVVYVPFHVIFLMLDAVSRRMFRFRELAVSDLVGTMAGSFLVAYVLARLGWSVWALVAGQAAYALIRMSFLVWSNRDMLSLRPSLAEARRLCRGGLAITVSEVANIASVYGTRPLIGAYLGPAAAGLWARYYQLIVVQLSVLVDPIDRLVLPALARRGGDGMTARVVALVQVISLLTLPAAVVTIVISPVAIPLAFGPGWEQLIVPMQIGAVALFLRGVDRVLLSATRSTGRMGPRAVAQVVQFLLIIGAFLIAMPYGLPAIAASFVVAQAVCLGLMIAVWQVSSSLSAMSVLKAMGPGALAGASGALALTPMLFGADFGPLTQTAAVLIGIALAFLFLLIRRRRMLSAPVNDLIDLLKYALTASFKSRLARTEG